MRSMKFLLVSAALALAGCGGDDASSTDADATESTAPAAVLGDADDLEEMQESVQDAAADFNTGEGGGTVTVAGVTYTVEAEICIVQQPDVSIEGPAVGSDGSHGWVSVNRSITSREDMVAIMGEDTVQLVFGDAETIDDASVDLSLGQTDMFGTDADDSQASWTASSGAASVDNSSLNVEPTATGLVGSGEAVDENGVAVPYGELVPIEVEVGCA